MLLPNTFKHLMLLPQADTVSNILEVSASYPIPRVPGFQAANWRCRSPIIRKLKYEMIGILIKPNQFTTQMGKSQVQINYHKHQPSNCPRNTRGIGIWLTWPMSRLFTKFSTCLSEIVIHGTLKSKPKHFMLRGTQRSELGSKTEVWVLQTRAYFLPERKFGYIIRTACFKASSEFWYCFIVLSNKHWRYFPHLRPEISLSMVWLSAVDETLSQE